jgi:hypothetical protein
MRREIQKPQMFETDPSPFPQQSTLGYLGKQPFMYIYYGRPLQWAFVDKS